ncbi:hypothetical protein BDV41DRAFT_574275 [Aspergillus transmontanensis]|uniref:RING-type domain-containing protein n=1 Tax=Aspergillus transmontanensis TaxID=1034304 RepID=A0A5N6W4Y4_9EURO|nr:hypothetical protein BDV41DRAFT_574275 [Aspergillus transmontanensis]
MSYELERKGRLQELFAIKWIEICLTRKVNRVLMMRWLLENEHHFHGLSSVRYILAPILEGEPLDDYSAPRWTCTQKTRGRIAYLRYRLEKEQELTEETRRQRHLAGRWKRVEFCHICIDLLGPIFHLGCGHRICWRCSISNDSCGQELAPGCNLCWSPYTQQAGSRSERRTRDITM